MKIKQTYLGNFFTEHEVDQRLNVTIVVKRCVLLVGLVVWTVGLLVWC